MRMAYVMWGDAHEQADEVDIKGWKHNPEVTHCIGFVIRDDERGISLCQEYWDSPERLDLVRHPTFIPKGMILLKQYLGE